MRVKQTKTDERRVVVGFDIGTKFGWSVWTSQKNDAWDWGYWDLGRGKTQGGGMQMVWLSEHLKELLHMWQQWADVDRLVVAFELISFHKGIEAAHIYGALSMRLMEQCERMDIPYQGVQLIKIRRLVTGKGRIKKVEIRKFLEGRLNCKFGTSDEADATAVAIAMASRLGWLNWSV
jgi:Holliday junction resolvasome RuvABC endonuclease subunit